MDPRTQSKVPLLSPSVCACDRWARDRQRRRRGGTRTRKSGSREKGRRLGIRDKRNMRGLVVQYFHGISLPISARAVLHGCGVPHVPLPCGTPQIMQMSLQQIPPLSLKNKRPPSLPHFVDPPSSDGERGRICGCRGGRRRSLAS